MKLCGLPDVTDSTGKAMPSSEKNAAINGTMASQIAELQSVLDVLKQPEVIPSSTGLKETLIGISDPEKFMKARNRKFVIWNPSVFGWYVVDITMWGNANNWNFNGILCPNTNQDGYLFHYHIPTYQFDLWKITN